MSEPERLREDESEPGVSGLPHDHPEASVAGGMLRDLGIAPSLTRSDSAHANLVEAIRQQTDEVVVRARAAVQREHDAAER